MARCHTHTSARACTHPLLAHVALQLPALLLDGLDAVNRLHAHGVQARDLRNPLHACGVAPLATLQGGGLKGAAHNGAQAALLDVILALCE
eukprot:1158032-Pelagomonas_calceolata.AAC.8